MKTITAWIVGASTLGVGCSGSGISAKPVPSSVATPMKLPSDAIAIDFMLVSGSVWAPSMRSRSVTLGNAEVVLAPAGFYGELTKSRAWWEETRWLLDRGLANVTSAGYEDVSTQSPSAVCEFELRVTTPRGEELLRGSCTNRSARSVELAFDRIVPSR
jgi:hypothetical protein